MRPDSYTDGKTDVDGDINDGDNHSDSDSDNKCGPLVRMSFFYPLIAFSSYMTMMVDGEYAFKTTAVDRWV